MRPDAHEEPERRAQYRETHLQRPHADPDPAREEHENDRNISLESVEFFDVEVVVDYVLLLDNATTATEVGFCLEQHSESLMVEPAQLEVLLRHRPRQPHYLEGARNGRGRLAST